MNPVVHFEMPYDDRASMVRFWFYQRVFGWQTQLLGEEMGIPGVGDYISFFDTEGNRVSLLHALPRPQPA